MLKIFIEMCLLLSLIFEPQNHGYHDINEDDLPEFKDFCVSQMDWNNGVATRNIENGKDACPIISKGPGYSEHDTNNLRDSSVGDLRIIRSNVTSYTVGGYIYELDAKVDEKMNVGTGIQNTSVSQTGNLESASGGAQPKTDHAMKQHRNIDEYNPQTTGLASPASTFEQFDRSRNVEAKHPAGNNEPMVENMSKLPSQEQINDPFYNSSTSREIHGNKKQIWTSSAGTFACNIADKDFVEKEKHFVLLVSIIRFYISDSDSILLKQKFDLREQELDLLEQKLDLPKQELYGRIINIVTNLDELHDIYRNNGQFMEEYGNMLSEITIIGIGNRRSNNSAESLSRKNYVYLLDVHDKSGACILIMLAYRTNRNRQYSQQKASTSDVIQQSIVSQLSSALYLLGGYGFDKGDENSTVLNILALRARRKSVLHRSYWLITEELFTNVIRQTIRVTDLYYTAIYPIDSRMNIYLPGLRGGFFYVKDI